MENSPKANWFVRALIIALILFVGTLIFFNFFYAVLPYQISVGLIILIFCLIILALSEAFDNFSIIRLFSLSKTVREKEKQNRELKQENEELRSQIISISTTICQKQVNSNVFLPESLAKVLSVTQADEPEREQKQENEQKEQKAEEIFKTPQTSPEAKGTRTAKSLAMYEKLALEKFLKREGLDQLPLVQDAKFTNLFQQIDPISEFSPIFDGYIKTFDTEIFIETKVSSASVFLRERLYLMLSKIHYYRKVKGVNAFLYLVLINRDATEYNRGYGNVERVYQDFQPALMNGLLKIQEIHITDEEYENQVKQNNKKETVDL